MSEIIVPSDIGECCDDPPIRIASLDGGSAERDGLLPAQITLGEQCICFIHIGVAQGPHSRPECMMVVVLYANGSITRIGATATGWAAMTLAGWRCGMGDQP